MINERLGRNPCAVESSGTVSCGLGRVQCIAYYRLSDRRGALIGYGLGILDFGFEAWIMDNAPIVGSNTKQSTRLVGSKGK